jgi:hypothetical protein
VLSVASTSLGKRSPKTQRRGVVAPVVGCKSIRDSIIERPRERRQSTAHKQRNDQHQQAHGNRPPLVAGVMDFCAASRAASPALLTSARFIRLRLAQHLLELVDGPPVLLAASSADFHGVTRLWMLWRRPAASSPSSFYVHDCVLVLGLNVMVSRPVPPDAWADPYGERALSGSERAYSLFPPAPFRGRAQLSAGRGHIVEFAVMAEPSLLDSKPNCPHEQALARSFLEVCEVSAGTLRAMGIDQPANSKRQSFDVR